MTELVVLRVARPYATESEFLQSEDWTITKKSLFLVGASSYPEGTIVRCELTLANGQQLLVAEGIVARFVHQTAERPAGLVVRFRRMTPASTQFVNRVLSIREPAEGSSPSAAHNPIPMAPKWAAPPGNGALSAEAPKRTAVTRTPLSAESADVLKRLSGRSPSPVFVPGDRDAVLGRLRNRG